MKLWFLLALLLAAGASPAVAGLGDVAPPPLTAEDVKAITELLSQAPTQGLPPQDVAAAVRNAASADPATRQAAEQALADAAIAFANGESGALADPADIDSNFALKATHDAAADFARARAAGQIAAWAASVQRHDPGFLALVRYRASYADIVAAGGWPDVPAGKALAPGAADARVPVLRQRLAIEGFSAQPGPKPDVFDAALSASLAAFQAHHRLRPDGVLNAQTTQALNVSADTRLAAVDANLERARWLPAQLPAMRIEVDAGDPSATLFEAGAPTLTMRAIVGQPTKRTPTFVSKVVSVVFNPPWLVPSDIAARELYPKERRSPGYFARHDFAIVQGRLIQRPGPQAALGFIKFDMPDPFTVYLHDTPSRTLFARDNRWLSHGCIRLQAPRELATKLLAPQGWTREAIDAAIAAKTTRAVALTNQPPVFVVYRTVVAGPDGLPVFRSDPYGWDAKIVQALDAVRHGATAAGRADGVTSGGG
ncbi:MAG TPA: L,D-transpeptidase family protein [Caulobacteraceae bacterium]|nr:L,D-transpeptidase family protein [Caulobacteraceae bacterium]